MSGQFLSVPVAAVDPAWFDRDLYPSFDSLRGVGRVVWMPIDAAEEGEYLLNRLEGRVGVTECVRCVVCPVDPLRFWSDLLGAACTPGRCQGGTGSVWLVEGGERLPTASHTDHLTAIRHWARGAGRLLVLPSFRAAIPNIPIDPADAVLRIPSLPDATANTLLALAEDVVAQRLPLLPADDRKDIARRLARARPHSRARLETWVSELATSDAPVTRIREQPPDAGEADRPREYPTRDQLRSRLEAVRESLRETEATLQAHRPELRLLFEHHDLPDPFASADPVAWYPSIISHVSCLLLDAGGKILLALAGWRVEGGKLFAPNGPAEFPAVLRCLRTTMQHALDRALSKDVEKAHEAEAWYRSTCGNSNPGPEYARTLTEVVLGLWEGFARDAHEVHTFLAEHPNTPESRPAWDRVARASGRLSEEDLYDIAMTVVSTVAPQLSVRSLVRDYRGLINDDLAPLGLQPEGLRPAAHRLVEQVVAALSNPCPVNGTWLKAECGVVGKSVKDWLNRRRNDWLQLRPEERNSDNFLHETRQLVAASRESK